MMVYKFFFSIKEDIYDQNARECPRAKTCATL